LLDFPIFCVQKFTFVQHKLPIAKRKEPSGVGNWILTNAGCSSEQGVLLYLVYGQLE